MGGLMKLDIDINCEECQYWDDKEVECLIHAEHLVKEGPQGVECPSYLRKVV